eukprot:GDKJ01003559.1.p1 GENE.GDKJ01003559.1~~GDKJ01003559.1.p1  ORF type:complete len:151 (+),score=22.69 GDKJ01003559.1:42-455(+)
MIKLVLWLCVLLVNIYSASAFRVVDKSFVKDVIANDYNFENQIFVLIDVRFIEEVESTSLIGNAVNIPLPELNQALLLDAESFEDMYKHEKFTTESLIVYCKSGFRAQKGALILEEAGYKNVMVYGGSYDDWVHDTI